MSRDRNAAIWFAPDGFDPKKGVNGRRMAGESFIRGFFRHAAVEEFVGLTYGPTDADAFGRLAADCGVTAPVRPVRLDDARAIDPVGTVYFSGPNYAPETWRRELWGATRYSICGITHTISTKAVMEGFWHLRAAPQTEWDAVICTSRAVHSALSVQFDLIDAHLKRRFGGVPPRPQMPVLPLGIDCDDFAPDPAAGAALRARLGIAEGDIVATIVARMSPHEKFDPLPVYLALQQAQAGTGQRLHLLLYGNFPDGYSERVFKSAAPKLMPDVGFHHLPHEGAALRRAALSAGQMFLFPIDNLQESFGLAPVEGMAAGLPVVASDWDGIRDTVDEASGFRIPTLGGRAEHTTLYGLRHAGGTDNYVQYLSQNSAMTELSVAGMARAVRALMQNPDLRARMGAAALARARGVFDWSVIIPQMQDLFAELAAIRKAADPARHPPISPHHMPVAPSPMVMFDSFPSGHLAKDSPHRYAPRPVTAGLAEVWALRDYAKTGREFEPLALVERVLVAVAEAAGGATAAEVAAGLQIPVTRVERCLLWLLKYDFIG
ncbi:glycosyltransferase [Paragemmobacter straminiformis]|uniref:Glycosyltransferase family 4 protein n=1 Tax=Paragemmobacter straminiformis TaxID=2045119 RepID=A0A842I833_9RHOB|nr:glycosyltransferase [Gemmobacter straminiformis]MBC2835234.1 glycosyltransferase family 4 protein [Gemmobacter straminiformis]